MWAATFNRISATPPPAFISHGTNKKQKETGQRSKPVDECHNASYIFFLLSFNQSPRIHSGKHSKDLFAAYPHGDQRSSCKFKPDVKLHLLRYNTAYKIYAFHAVDFGGPTLPWRHTMAGRDVCMVRGEGDVANVKVRVRRQRITTSFSHNAIFYRVISLPLGTTSAHTYVLAVSRPVTLHP